MWRESLIFERDGSWMRFGLPTKKVQRSDLGSSRFIDSIVRGLLKIDRLFLKCLFLKDKRTS